ncbi:hypothetical protein FZO89_10040 [Luteimonas viscosa]|uniref:Uncharacterized protein n=1 Tax=Luteimonas viscosa TaxID=1132694 RepID=A0A5D4XPR4_9GAMM|nr:hypothetical protein [Luteimonas viscosa]TYT26569.1 hypothetical protein FZO89_10040 [Luteimonas viscosa]
MTNPNPLTENELRAAAYFAVGVTSEGSIAGRDVAYRLSFAGNVGAGGRMEPVANSGYSFGTMQVDLGQHPAVARDLLERYQAWAATQPDRAALELSQDDCAAVLASLQRTGRQMRADDAVDIDRSVINRFLASDDGRTFVHGLDTAHVDGVTAMDGVVGNRDTALERLRRTDLYRNATGDEQAELAGMFMKLQNQAGRARWPGLLDRVEAGTLTSSDAVKTAIDGLLPNQPNGNPDYLQSGADNTLRGIGVLNALRGADADNPLARAWASVSADPLVGPVAAHRSDAASPELGFEYDTVRSLFLTPEASRRFIAALDRGAALAEGSPQPQANGSRQAGFYVSGDDFVHWNRNGQGQAFIGGQWRSIDPDDLTRVRNADGTTELRIDEHGRRATLLRVDPTVPGLRADATMASDNEESRDFVLASPRDRAPGPGQMPVSTSAIPFENPYLNRMLAAVTAGDESGASGIALEFAQSPQGIAFIRRGEQLLAQQQGEEREVRPQSAGQRQGGEFERA